MQAALKRESPSAGAKNSVLVSKQKEGIPDAVYNGLPFDLTAPPIEIYHPVFAAFRAGMASDINSFDFSDKELNCAYEFMANSSEFYQDADARVQNLTSLAASVHGDILRREYIPGMQPDGTALLNLGGVFVAAMAFAECKNGAGEGGCDAIHQAEGDHVCFHSAEQVRPILS